MTISLILYQKHTRIFTYNVESLNWKSDCRLQAAFFFKVLWPHDTAYGSHLSSRHKGNERFAGDLRQVHMTGERLVAILFLSLYREEQNGCVFILRALCNFIHTII